MIAGLVVLAIILGTVFHQYLKGTVIRAFIMLISAISAMAVSMNYYESISAILMAKGWGGAWAAPGILMVLFVATFFILKTVMELLLGEPLHFSNLVDRVVCSICGIFTAIIFMGILLISLAMTPSFTQWPYQRFDIENPDINKISKVLIPADDIVAGLFSTISSGALSANNNFTATHPDFINQLHANRQRTSEGVLNIAAKDCLVIKKNSVWKDDSLKDASTGDLFSNSSDGPTVVRLAIKPGSIADGGAQDADGKMNFTLAQIQLIATEKSNKSITTSYRPAGYISSKNGVEPAKLFEIIETTRSNFKVLEGFGKAFFIDLVFDIPSKYKPTAITFRNNAMASLPKVISADQKPEYIIFFQASKCETQKANFVSITAKIKPLQLTAKNELMLGLDLKTGKSALKKGKVEISDIDNDSEFGEKGYSIANIRISPTSDQIGRGNRANLGGIPSLLAPMPGFSLIALKCSIEVGSEIDASDFPILEELAGQQHYPVGLIVGGTSNGSPVYQLIYCSQPDILVIEDSRVTQSYPQDISIVSQLDQVDQAYFIYLVKPSNSNVIKRVKTGNKTASFKNTQGFILTTGK